VARSGRGVRRPYQGCAQGPGLCRARATQILLGVSHILPIWRDALGQTHGRVASPARIVSLVPSITELLCELGLADQMVGRTGYCVHPAALVRRIPKVGGTKTVNIEKIRRVAPTHLIVNIDENEKPTVEALSRFVPNVIVTHPQRPEDNLLLYDLLGGVFGAEHAAQAFATRLREKLSELSRTRYEVRRTLYLIWKNPWMTVSRNTYIANTLALCGFMHIETAASVRYPTIELSAHANGVDALLLSSEPYSFTTLHVAELAALYPAARVSLIDGTMTSWYGSRAIEGLGYLDEFARRYST
jgi:ABC-type Fe3+-hydroxamate transport system substrate-binding protein